MPMTEADFNDAAQAVADAIASDLSRQGAAVTPDALDLMRLRLRIFGLEMQADGLNKAIANMPEDRRAA